MPALADTRAAARIESPRRLGGDLHITRVRQALAQDRTPCILQAKYSPGNRARHLLCIALQGLLLPMALELSGVLRGLLLGLLLGLPPLLLPPPPPLLLLPNPQTVLLLLHAPLDTAPPCPPAVAASARVTAPNDLPRIHLSFVLSLAIWASQGIHGKR